MKPKYWFSVSKEIYKKKIVFFFHWNFYYDLFIQSNMLYGLLYGHDLVCITFCGLILSQCDFYVG